MTYFTGKFSLQVFRKQTGKTENTFKGILDALKSLSKINKQTVIDYENISTSDEDVYYSITISSEDIEGYKDEYVDGGFLCVEWKYDEDKDIIKFRALGEDAHKYIVSYLSSKYSFLFNNSDIDEWEIANGLLILKKVEKELSSASSKDESTTAGTIGEATTSTTPYQQPSEANYQYGWVCPRCGKVNAPWKKSCDCVPSTIPYTPPAPYIPYPYTPYDPWKDKWGDDPRPIPNITCSVSSSDYDNSQKIKV